MRYSKIKSRYYYSYCLTTTIIRYGHLGVTRKRRSAQYIGILKYESKIPNITTVPESTLLNFVILAESVALAPMVYLRVSSDKFSPREVEIFNLLTLEALADLLVL